MVGEECKQVQEVTGKDQQVGEAVGKVGEVAKAVV